MTLTATSRLLGLLGAASLAFGGCDHGGSHGDKPDGSTPPATLTLSITLKAPALDGLIFDGGRLGLRRVSLFGDVAADQRTTVDGINMELPSDSEELTLEEAPFGLYSRVRIEPDDLAIEGSWRGTPLSVRAEAEWAVDLRGPTLDYGPGQAAHFALTIDSGQWLDATTLDSAAVDDGQIHIDYFHNQGIALGLPKAVQGSFTLDAPGDPSP